MSQFQEGKFMSTKSTRKFNRTKIPRPERIKRPKIVMKPSPLPSSRQRDNRALFELVQSAVIVELNKLESRIEDHVNARINRAYNFVVEVNNKVVALEAKKEFSYPERRKAELDFELVIKSCAFDNSVLYSGDVIISRLKANGFLILFNDKYL